MCFCNTNIDRIASLCAFIISFTMYVIIYIYYVDKISRGFNFADDRNFQFSRGFNFVVEAFLKNFA